MAMEWFDAGPRRCWARILGQVPAGGAPLVVVLAGGEQPELEALCARLEAAADGGRCTGAVLAGPLQVDWDADFTPWPAEDGRGRVFAGRADALLAWVRQVLVPAAAARFPLSGQIYPVGYSLGGLAALYFACQGGFAGAGSCSGSLWYPGFTAYLAAHLPAGPVYLSLGGKERNTRHPLMAAVEDATAEARRLLACRGPVAFVHERGGHFTDVPGRLARAVCWLLAPAGPGITRAGPQGWRE